MCLWAGQQNLIWDWKKLWKSMECPITQLVFCNGTIKVYKESSSFSENIDGLRYWHMPLTSSQTDHRQSRLAVTPPPLGWCHHHHQQDFRDVTLYHKVNSLAGETGKHLLSKPRSWSLFYGKWGKAMSPCLHWWSCAGGGEQLPAAPITRYVP